MFDAGAAAQMGAAMGGLAAAAEAGAFAVDPVEGEKMRLTISQMKDKVQDTLADIGSTRRMGTPLGGLEIAKAVAAQNQLVLSGDDQSFESVLKKFYTTLSDAEDALRKGMRNYTQVEDGNAGNLNGVQA
jgi:hypothetical protein